MNITLNFEKQKNEYYDFFINFLDSMLELFDKNSYDFVILTTRRCFCLFYALEKDYEFKTKYKNWFDSNGVKFQILKNKIISSQSIDIIGDYLENKNILLVDDIMIHGTTVYKFYKKALKYGANNIDTLVMIRNIENPDYYYYKTQKYYSIVYQRENIDWKQISNFIVSYLHSMNQLYISYIYGYTIDRTQLNNTIKDSSSFVFCDHDFGQYIKHKTFKNNLTPKYYSYEKLAEYSFIRSSYLRVYDCDNSSNLYVIPYVDIKAIEVVRLEEIWNKIWKEDCVPEELQRLKTATDRYKALIAILSHMMHKQVFGNNYKNATEEVDKSYVNGFIDIITKNIKENIFDVIEDVCKRQNIVLEDTSVTIMNESINEIPNPFGICELEQYFYSVGQKEDEFFKNKVAPSIVNNNLDNDEMILSRTAPISADRFYSLLSKTYKNIVFPMTIFLLDNGVSSHVVRTRNGYVGTYIKAGEQSYHLFSDLAGNAFKAVYVLLDYINKFVRAEDESAFKRLFIQELERRNEPQLFHNRGSLALIINNPPVDYRADYFSVLQDRNKCMSDEDKKEEQNILKIFVDIIKKIINAEN